MKVAWNASTIVFKIFDDISGRPSAVRQFFKSIAAWALPAFSVVDSRFAAIKM